MSVHRVVVRVRVRRPTRSAWVAWALSLAFLLTVVPLPGPASATDGVSTIVVSEVEPVAKWTTAQKDHVDPNAESAPLTGEFCANDEAQQRYCETTLLRVDVDPSFWDTRGGGVILDVTIDPDENGIAPHEVHWYVWESDAEGTRLGTRPIGPHPGLYSNLPKAGAVIPSASGYYRIEVVYAKTTDQEQVFAGRATLRSRPLIERTEGDSLPTVTSGELPGPDVLYAEPPKAPQLENHDPRFDASPLLVSGSDAYIDGEYLYQDYLYDDWGADTSGSTSGGGQCVDATKHHGDITYPKDFKRYGGNAADLVEFRIDSSPASVAYRVTLNTLRAIDSTIVAIAFDADLDANTGSPSLLGKPGAEFPGTDEVLRIWGTGAAHDRWADGKWITTPLDVATDLDANQMTVEVSRKISDPSGKWRTTIAAGLYDPLSDGWLIPNRSPSGIFNVGFRFDEPVDNCNFPPDTRQSVVLADNEPWRFAHDIDFDKLADRVVDSNVPTTGYQTRIFASRLVLRDEEGRPLEGRDMSKWPSFLGQLQPYSLYIPTGTPSGLALAMHGGTSSHWHFHGLQLVHLLGEESRHLVAMPHARTAAKDNYPHLNDGWWRNEAEYEVFEVWNDVARHFVYPSDRTLITGGSAGGYGAYRLGLLYPDLFGKALTLIAPPGEGGWVPPAPPSGARPIGDFMPETLTNLQLENARNLPFMNIVLATDEIVSFAGTRAQNLGAPEFGIKGFNDLGYRFRFLVFDGGDHFGLNGGTPLLAPGARSMPDRVARFVEDDLVDRDPRRVTFAYVPAADEPGTSPQAALGLSHDHAYWVSDVRLATEVDRADLTFPSKGLIDIISHAFGKGEPAHHGFGDVAAPGTGSDGAAPGVFKCTPHVTPDCGTLLFTEYSRGWDEAPDVEPQNHLEIVEMANVSKATIDGARAGLDLCSSISISVNTDSAAELLLAGLTVESVTGADYRQTSDGVVLELVPGAAEIVLEPDCRGRDEHYAHEDVQASELNKPM